MTTISPDIQFLKPGAYVYHPDEDWGLGQIQSIEGTRITCNFEHRGKVTINGSVIELIVVDINTLPDSVG